MANLTRTVCSKCDSGCQWCNNCESPCYTCQSCIGCENCNTKCDGKNQCSDWGTCNTGQNFCKRVQTISGYKGITFNWDGACYTKGEIMGPGYFDISKWNSICSFISLRAKIGKSGTWNQGALGGSNFASNSSITPTNPFFTKKEFMRVSKELGTPVSVQENDIIYGSYFDSLRTAANKYKFSSLACDTCNIECNVTCDTCNDCNTCQKCDSGQNDSCSGCLKCDNKNVKQTKEESYCCSCNTCEYTPPPPEPSS